tara:strand:+ start:299 stop:460 length:162 start_codon:yes stop_codon:yes gene_type:complete
MDKREQLRQSLMYYMRLHYTNQKTLKKIGRPNFFKPVIEELEQEILELDNEKR